MSGTAIRRNLDIMVSKLLKLPCSITRCNFVSDPRLDKAENRFIAVKLRLNYLQ